MRTTNPPRTTDGLFAWFRESQDICEVTEDLCRHLDERQSSALAAARSHMTDEDIDEAAARSRTRAHTAVEQVAMRQRQREAIRATSARFTRKFDEAIWHAIHDEGETVESLSEQLGIPRRTIVNSLRSHEGHHEGHDDEDVHDQSDEDNATTGSANTTGNNTDVRLNLLSVVHWRNQSRDHTAEIVCNLKAAANDLRDMVAGLETIDGTQETIDRLDHARGLLRQVIAELDASPER